MLLLISLCIFSALAGFIDSIVGGGGLIQLPALMILLPSTPLPLLFGTNKFSAGSGTAMAVWRYALQVKISWHSILHTAGAAFVGSFLGARVVSLLNPILLRPVIFGLLILVALYTYKRKDFGSLHAPKLTLSKERLYGVIAGGAIGFYDGFFGPGTGSFLIILFIGLYGFDFLSASASAKIVNLATNLSAIIYFALTQKIIYAYAVPMAACNIAGAILGANLAIAKGSKFVRNLFLVVVSALIIKLGYDLWFF